MKSDLFAPTLTLSLKTRGYSGYLPDRSLNKFFFAIIVAAMLFSFASASYATEAKPFSFALMGDVPYHDGQVMDVERMLGEISAENIAFVVHLGDFKKGGSRCTDELFFHRRQLFNQSMHPFIFVPGDNEWVDCSRKSAGGYVATERLAKLRELFMADNQTLGRNKMILQRQSDDPLFVNYRENARWSQENVLFATLNIPGGNNNLGNGQVNADEAKQRNLANASWIKQTIAQAKKLNMPGVMFFIQADPMFEYGSTQQGMRAYREFLDLLREQTEKFSGQVVLAHGDTHFYRVDQPLRNVRKGGRIKNFTRVEVFGSPGINWVRVHVDANSPRVFRFEVGR